jgi:DNA-directed RNA polymerase specialized sigma24 family protein
MAPEPAREWQDAIHRRITKHEPTAFAELCEAALPHLVSFLGEMYPGQDAHTRETTAIDLLLDYRKRPTQYHANRLSLFAYLRMAAKYDMLNQIEKQRRRERWLTDLDDAGVALQLADRNTEQDNTELEEWLKQYTDLSLREVFVEANAQLDERDQQMLLMMLEGIRETSAYAELLGIDGLDEAARRQEVKRAKDRIMKRLKRLRRRIERRHG